MIPKGIAAVFVKSRANAREQTVINSINEGNLLGQWSDFNRSLHDETILISSLNFSDISVRQFYRGNIIEYKSLTEFLILVKYYEIKCEIKRYTDTVCQFLFNRKRLVTHDRMVILRRLVEYYYEAGEHEISIIDLMCKLYTDRWLDHPKGEAQEAKLRLYLKSFVISGDVEEAGSENHYRVTGKAIITLEEYEKESRRNRLTDFLQWIMITLTIILALGTLIQAQVIKFNWFLDLSAVCDKLQSFFH